MFKLSFFSVASHIICYIETTHSEVKLIRLQKFRNAIFLFTWNISGFYKHTYKSSFPEFVLQSTGISVISSYTIKQRIQFMLFQLLNMILVQSLLKIKNTSSINFIGFVQKRCKSSLKLISYFSSTHSRNQHTSKLHKNIL